MRASVIHGMAGMAAFAASTCKAFLGRPGAPEPLNQAQNPHPSRCALRGWNSCACTFTQA
jgi:hypothetical protein